MARSKDGPALFEIMRKRESTLPRTGNAGQQGGTQHQDEDRSDAEFRVAAPDTTDRPPIHRGGGVGNSTGADRQSAEAPLFEVVGGRVRLSLTSQGTAIAVFIVGLVLVASYTAGLYIGRQRGEQDGFAAGRKSVEAIVTNEIEQARAQRPTEGIFDGVGTSPVGRSGPDAGLERTVGDGGSTSPEMSEGSSAAAWVRGYTYIVVQDFKSDALADAHKAARYLADNGVDTAIVELDGDWKYRLITLQGFNRDEAVQRNLAEEYLERVRTLGQNYFAAGGRYRLEGYFKKLAADTW